MSRRGASSTRNCSSPPSATGTSSRSKRPPSIAAIARRFDSSAYASSCSAGDPPLLRDLLRRDPLIDDRPPGRDLLVQPGKALDTEVRPHRHARHRLDARRDDDVEMAGLDRGGGVEGRLHRRAALPIDGRRRDGLGPSGDERGDPRDVEGLLADLRHAPHLDVLDLGRIEPDPADEAVQRIGREIVRANAGERSVAAADRRSDGVDDECLGHAATLPARPRLSGACSGCGLRQRSTESTRACAPRRGEACLARVWGDGRSTPVQHASVRRYAAIDSARMTTTATDRKLLIDGDWVETGSWLEVASPFDGSPVARVAKVGAAETRRAIDAAARAMESTVARSQARGDPRPGRRCARPPRRRSRPADLRRGGEAAESRTRGGGACDVDLHDGRGRGAHAGRADGADGRVTGAARGSSRSRCAGRSASSARSHRSTSRSTSSPTRSRRHSPRGAPSSSSRRRRRRSRHSCSPSSKHGPGCPPAGSTWSSGRRPRSGTCSSTTSA